MTLSAGTIEFASLNIALIGALVVPIASFLIWGWRDRRRGILDSFSDAGIRAYYSIFFPNVLPQKGQIDVRKAFEGHYQSRFGRKQFALPVIVLLAVAGLAICLTTGRIYEHTNLLSLYGEQGSSSTEAWVAVSAIAGAYMWVLSDFILRGRRNHFVVSDINRGTLRFIIAAPIAYAIGAAAKPEVGIPIGLFLGAFPTDTVFKLIRRKTMSRLEMQDDVSASTQHQLEQLASIDTKAAELLADEGISNVSQLAYCDPVDLTLRSGFTFGHVADCVGEALAFIYLGNDRMEVVRRFSLRGAQEIYSLMESLDGDNKKESDKARNIVKALAKYREFNVDPDSMEFLLRLIVEDPHTEFLMTVWSQE